MNYYSISKDKLGNMFFHFEVDNLSVTFRFSPQDCKKFLYEINEVLNDLPEEYISIKNYFDLQTDFPETISD